MQKWMRCGDPKQVRCRLAFWIMHTAMRMAAAFEFCVETRAFSEIFVCIFFLNRFLVSSKFLMFQRVLRPNIAQHLWVSSYSSQYAYDFSFVFFFVVFNNINDDDVVYVVDSVFASIVASQFRRASEIQIIWKVYGKIKTLTMTTISYLARTWFISLIFVIHFFPTANSSRIEFYLKEWIVVPYLWIQWKTTG